MPGWINWENVSPFLEVVLVEKNESSDLTRGTVQFCKIPGVGGDFKECNTYQV